MTDQHDDQHDDQYDDNEDVCAGRHGGDEYSAAANDRIAEDKNRLRNLIYSYIETCCEARGATCEEVERALGLRHQTASARITELRKSGRLINIPGERRYTRSGATARVHRVNQ